LRTAKSSSLTVNTPGEVSISRAVPFPKWNSSAPPARLTQAMVAGRMACGVVHDDLMVRVGPDGHDEAIAQPHARPMDFTGKPMRGMVYVAPAGVASDDDLRNWVDRAVSVATAEALPTRAAS
jgi:hypothetical protein